MFDWYPLFLVVVFLLWRISTPQDRIALRIVFIATLGSELLVDGVTRHTIGGWKLVIPFAVDVATVVALTIWSFDRAGRWQSRCLAVACLAHLLCWVAVSLKTKTVFYTHYETILMAVAAVQIAGFHDTIGYNLRRLDNALHHWLDSIRPRRAVAFRPVSLRSRLLPDP